jgi:arabinofuranosyltransferase
VVSAVLYTHLIDQTFFPLRRLLSAIATIVFAVILFRTAWISDDAAITLRTVLNVTHGFGLTFNIAERVQTYTHPLWMGLLTIGYLIVGNVYIATFAIGMMLSIIAFWLGLTRAVSPFQSICASITLLFSTAFVDFSTSGLENPLLYVLVALFVGLFLNPTMSTPRRLTLLWTIASFLYLTRPDAVLVAAPLLVVASWRADNARMVLPSIVLGSLPAIGWTIFALIYYGFPFPNTAYAKLATGIDSGELRAQGVLYLLDSLDRDPITLTAIAVTVVVAAFQRSLAPRALAAGVILYLGYVVSIGGDFMTGRFLALPVFASVLLMTRLVGPSGPLWGTAAGVLLIVGCTATHVPLWSNSRNSDASPKPSGIVDERAVYFRDRSLAFAKRGTFRDPDWPSSPWHGTARNVVATCGLMGAGGIDLGPYVHLLDECALADPLLARLPAVFNPDWRTGHYRRMIPDGYRESLESSTNQLRDPNLHRYYDRLRLITRSDRLFTRERLAAIVAMNLRRYDRDINRQFYRHAGSVASLEQLSAIRSVGSPYDAQGNHVLTQPLAIQCPPRTGRRYLDVTLDSDDRYLLTFLAKGRTVSTLELGPIPEHRRQPGLTDYTADVPGRARSTAFDTIVVATASGDAHNAIGHLLLEGNPATDWELYRRVALRDGLSATK